MDARLDPRRHPYRADIAAEHLRDKVAADRYVTAKQMQVTVPVLDLVGSPNSGELASQLLFGERFEVFEISGDFAWGQAKADGYVGYVAYAGLGELAQTNARISALRSHIYPRPDFKTTPIGYLPYLSRLSVIGTETTFAQTSAGFVPVQHISLDEASDETDFLAQAMRFLHAPYLWGGRSLDGIDCSALVQLALMATGQECPRDSDMQMAELGKSLADGTAVEAGDLFFWKGHVAIAKDAKTLVHANAHHMSVTLEPLKAAIERIAITDGPVLAHKRIS